MSVTIHSPLGRTEKNCWEEQIKKKLHFFQPPGHVLLMGVPGLCSDPVSFSIATAFSYRICGFSDVPELR